MIHQFHVRNYQRPFHEALVNRTHDRLIAIWHRRAGKDEVVLNAMRDLALRDPGTYWHCFPEQSQARKAIWNGIDGRTGKSLGSAKSEILGASNICSPSRKGGGDIGVALLGIRRPPLANSRHIARPTC